MNRAAGPVLYGLILLYPFLVYFGLQKLPHYLVAGFLLALALLRLWYCRGRANQQLVPLVLASILGLVALYSLALGNVISFRFYPVLVSLFLLLFFGFSLTRERTVVENIARIRDPELPATAVRYTRKVTIIWCLFFLVNGSVALWTAVDASMETWALYNGAISYVLMGLLFAGEWMVRQRVMAGDHE